MRSHAGRTGERESEWGQGRNGISRTLQRPETGGGTSRVFMMATLAETPSSEDMDPEVAMQDSQWKDKDYNPPIKPSTQNVSCLQHFQGQI